MREHYSNMSLPPGFLEELRNRSSLSQVVGRKVTWEQKKTNISKGDYWAPCPFHSEKTASFHVDDKKGFYYCFGCHEKGDAISFIRNSENVSFIEAVEILAREAGMTMPARDPKAQEKIDINKELANIMESAVQFYKMQFNGSNAKSAKDYIKSRGLSGDTINIFEIGFAPNDRTSLSQFLLNKGIPEDKIIDAGLAIKPDDGGNIFDRFRGRIMFPIRNTQGRCIAFGGRAMDPNARAKYLNSNETALFDKGRSLYNHGLAREASGKANSLIVAEGYMDVIALSQFGFKHAVAPLGTAITENQLALIWRIHHEPIIALDGDTAGLRAALRLIDLALPLLETGKSLRFCILPTGQDPDDILKEKGAAYMQELLENAVPMVNLLWQRETEGKDFDSPERRALLDKSLRTAVMKIRDKSIRHHYGQAIKELRYKLFAPINNGLNPLNKSRSLGYSQVWGKKPKLMASANTKSSMLAIQSDETNWRLRESLILASAIKNQSAALKNESALERCPITTPDLVGIMNAILINLHIKKTDAGMSDSFEENIQNSLGYSPIDKLMKLKPLKKHPYLKNNTDPDLIQQTLEEELAKHVALIGAQNEIKEAEQDLTGLVDEGLTWRLQQAAMAKTKATRAIEEEDSETDENSLEMSKNLQNMLDNQIWVKKTR
jgi:DNA primase|tara:strand:+ start:6740 stop:8731 length:1992 start_codon:yes stop_codon:yes gene_type:complete